MKGGDNIEAELSRFVLNDRHRLIVGLDYGTTYSGTIAYFGLRQI